MLARMWLPVFLPDLFAAPPLRNRAFGRISCVAFRVACVGLPRHVSQKRHILHGISHARGFAGGEGGRRGGVLG